MIADSDIPAETVRAFAAHMAEEYGARIVLRGSDLVGAAVDTGLRAIGLDPSRYATTVGRTIYVPEPIGADHATWNRWGQIVTITHECQHIHQHDTTGLVAHALRYARAAGRTMLEADAYATEMELARWRYGTVEQWWIDWRPRALGAYLVSEADIATMRRVLLSRAPTVRRGGVVTHAGRTAIGWLDEHAPELRAPGVASRAPS